MSFKLPNLSELDTAARLVYSHMPPTPQYNWPLLDAVAGTEVWVKHENHTPVGSFKIRGGIVYLDWLRRTQSNVKGVVGATKGNHGQSVGFSAKILGLQAVVVSPFGNSQEKNAATRALGVELLEIGEDFQSASDYADSLTQKRGMHRLPSFDPLLVQGVGTYALEFFRGSPQLDTVYVPIGLGSGICGVIAARDALRLKTKIVGVVASGAPAYLHSFQARQVIPHKVTTVLADGLACRIPDIEALTGIIEGAERVVAVDDMQVAAAMRTLFRATHNVAEGAGAASFAALMSEKDAMQDKRVGVVLSGGNVDAKVFAEVLAIP